MNRKLIVAVQLRFSVLGEVNDRRQEVNCSVGSRMIEISIDGEIMNLNSSHQPLNSSMECLLRCIDEIAFLFAMLRKKRILHPYLLHPDAAPDTRVFRVLSGWGSESLPSSFPLKTPPIHDKSYESCLVGVVKGHAQ